MKLFGVTLLQLDFVSFDIVLQVVKKAIRPNTQFFDSLTQPLALIDELFQRGNQYTMLEDDVVAATKRTVASAFGGRSSNGGQGKGSRRDEDTQHKRHDGIQIQAL